MYKNEEKVFVHVDCRMDEVFTELLRSHHEDRTTCVSIYSYDWGELKRK